MGPLGELSSVLDGFRDRMGRLTPDDWRRPTPCTDWDVAELVRHVIAGNVMITEMVRGATRDDAAHILDDYVLTSDPDAAFVDSSRTMMSTFGEPGAMERTAHHLLGDVPVIQLARFRTTDVLVHTWDLARATGLDEQLDDGAVASVWQEVEPIAPTLGAIGMFGSGPSGLIGADAPVQDRFLDAFGRRP